MEATSTNQLDQVWVARLDLEGGDSAQRLRAMPGVEFAEDASVIWLRGPMTNAHELPKELSAVRWKSIFQLLDGGLTPLESSVPVQQLPNLDWKPIEQWSQPQSISSAFPPQLTDRCSLKLIRDPRPSEPTLLQTSFDAFATWVCQAPEIRLKPLRFAVSDSGDTLIFGSPIPSLPGERFVVSSNAIACPAGRTWDPPAPLMTLIQLFDLKPGDLAVLRNDGSHDVVPNSNLIPVSRAAVRLTLND